MRQGGCSRFQHHPSEVLRQCYPVSSFPWGFPAVQNLFLGRNKHCLASRVSVWYGSLLLAMGNCFTLDELRIRAAENYVWSFTLSI